MALRLDGRRRWRLCCQNAAATTTLCLQSAFHLGPQSGDELQQGAQSVAMKVTVIVIPPFL